MTVDINSTPNREDVADASAAASAALAAADAAEAAADSGAASETATEDLKQRSKQDAAAAAPAAQEEAGEDSNGNDHADDSPDDSPDNDEYTEERQDIIPDRIFVGNLPYEVTENDVRNLTPEFEVVSVEIPRKNFFNRSLNKIVLQSKGYGFITYTNAEDAKNAIDSIVGKSISGREIYAKYALPQNKNRFRNLNNNNQNQFPGNFKKGFYGMPNNYNPHFNLRNGGAPPNFYYPPPPPANGSFYAAPPPPPQSIQSANVNSPSYFKPNPQAAAFFPNLNNRNIKPFYPTPIPLNGQPQPQSQQQSQQQQQQQHTLQQQQQQQQLRGFNPHYPRSKEEKQRKLEKGVPSTTTIFVGNLDRNVTVDDLRDFMKELSPQWVKVPRKTLPNDVYKMLKANGVQIQNKGIAFVRFDNEENQKQAIESFNGKDWNGKKLNVTVAINSNDEGSTTATSASAATTSNDNDNDNEAVEGQDQDQDQDQDQAEAEAEDGGKLGDSQSVDIEIEGEPSQVEEAASEIVETVVEEAEDDDDDVEIEVAVSEPAAQ